MSPNDYHARLAELDRLRRSHIRGLQLSAYRIKQVVREAAAQGVYLELPAKPGRRRNASK